jgi:glutamate/tyrosine decarboxylase-like PLP-dependent enzyme
MHDAVDKTLSDTLRGLVRVHERTVQTLSSHAGQHDLPVLPRPIELQEARHSLSTLLPQAGSGTEETTTHLLSISQAFNAGSLSSHYYGFVTGGVTPAARIADGLVTLYDQNVAVHLPNDTITTDVEEQALAMLTQLFGLADHADNTNDSPDWKLRILTTGATASNVLGLISAREYVTNSQNHGLLHAAKQPDPVEKVKVLTTMGHSSLKKAANIAGIGANNVIDVAAHGGISFDLTKLTAELAKPGHRSIVSVSCGEVNTGAFATHSEAEMRNLRLLCDQHRAWLHVDGGTVPCTLSICAYIPLMPG